MAGKADSGFKFNQPTIIALLYLASFVTGLTGLVGVVLAFIWKGEGGKGWEASHYSFHIRTFVFGLIGIVAGVVLSIILIGYLILLAVTVWTVVRSVVALLAAQKENPIPDPKTLFI